MRCQVFFVHEIHSILLISRQKVILTLKWKAWQTGSCRSVRNPGKYVFLSISPALFASISIVIGSKSDKSNATPEEWGIFVDMSKVMNFKPSFQTFKRMIQKYVKRVSRWSVFQKDSTNFQFPKVTNFGGLKTGCPHHHPTHRGGLLWCLGPSVREWAPKKPFMSPCCFFEIFKSLLLISTHHTPPQHHNNWHKKPVFDVSFTKKSSPLEIQKFSLSNSQERSWMNQPSHIPFNIQGLQQWLINNVQRRHGPCDVGQRLRTSAADRQWNPWKKYPVWGTELLTFRSILCLDTKSEPR